MCTGEITACKITVETSEKMRPVGEIQDDVDCIKLVQDKNQSSGSCYQGDEILV